MNTRTSLLLVAFVASLATASCTDAPTGTGSTAGMQGNGSAGTGATDPNGNAGLCADGSHPIVKADGSVVCSDGSSPTGNGGTSGGGTLPGPPGACGDAMCDIGCCSESCSLCTGPDGTCNAVTCDPSEPTKCPPEACGPAPKLPSTICPDGSVSGPTCEGAADGTCTWTVHDCPTTPEPQGCGSRGLKECPPGQFCFFQPGADCGRADAPGVCADYPTLCTMLEHPLCGCDGNDYANVCLAASQGVGIDHEGACKTDGGGDTCGGFAGLACPMGQYCNYAPPDGLGCLVADGSGVCREQPSACTKEYAPVCGCDGMTYGNKCQAASAAVSISKTGECAAASTKCGDAKCTDKQYCDRDVGHCDGAGTCMTRGDVCPAIYAPVCGCDGKTYGNDCQANGNGTGVVHEGACK